MSYDTLGMIRRGWQDGAATVAPHVPGLADLLERRLSEATRLGRLDEVSLLAIVDAATQLAADSGSVDVAPALSKRLRRHVYEYLLSLDAIGDAVAAAPAGQAPAPEGLEMLIGADEVATMGGPELPEAEVMIPGSNGGSHGYPPPSHLAAAGTPYPGVETRSPNQAQTPYLDPAAEPSPLAGAETPHRAPEPLYLAEEAPYVAEPGEEETREAEQAPTSTPPQFSFHIGDPDDLLTSRTPPEEGGPAAGGPEARDPFDAGDTDGLATSYSPPRRRASFSDPSTWPKPVTPTLRRESPSDGLLRPEQPASGATTPPSPGGGHFEDLGSWPAARSADPGARSVFEDLGRWSSSWPDPKATLGQAPVSAGSEGTSGPAPSDFEPAGGHPAHNLDEGWHDAAEEWFPGPGSLSVPIPEIPPGWSVREPEAVELHLAAPADPAPATSSSLPGEIPESDLVALRAAVDDRLRKKRCDDVAAVLQQAAQELGGQAVAELALDAGDRCRTLGKRNAALNCYLAASRADPVYEPPLARLADICIDDQDIDLAVSYLERIARLTRLRGDTRGALRIYRKIATIAPYRDDVLEMLMRAQTTGRIDS
jgi:hypothetical protein